MVSDLCVVCWFWLLYVMDGDWLCGLVFVDCVVEYIFDCGELSLDGCCSLVLVVWGCWCGLFYFDLLLKWFVYSFGLIYSRVV